MIEIALVTMQSFNLKLTGLQTQARDSGSMLGNVKTSPNAVPLCILHVGFLGIARPHPGKVRRE